MRETRENEMLSSPRRFWELVKSEGGALVWLNLVFLLTCVPVVTIPPAVYALDLVVRGMLEEKPGRVKDFWAAFRKNVIRSYGVFLLTALPLFASGYGMLFYFQFAAEHWWCLLPFMLCSTIFLLVLLSSVYLYRLLVNGRLLSRDTVRLAMLLAVGRPLRALLAALWYFLPAFIAILCLPFSALYLLFLGGTFPCLLGNLVLRKVLLLDEQV